MNGATIGSVSNPKLRTLELPFWPLGLATLWEFYFAGIRPLDHLVVALYIFLFIIQNNRKVDTEKILKTYVLCAPLFLAAVVGALSSQGSWRPTIGILEGFFLLFIFSSADNNIQRATRFLRWLILIHAVALLFQFFVFELAHVTINYFGWLGRATRVDVSGGIRPGGLFLEPAAFCLVMFSLLSAFRLLGSKCWWTEATGIIAILLSLSLWGVGSTLVYLTLFRPKWLLLFVPLLFGGAVFLYIKFGPLLSHNSILDRLLVHRLMNIGKDRSGQARYGALLDGEVHSQWFLWFGEGISDKYESYGANGLSFLLTAMGIIGTLLLCFILFAVAPTGRRFKSVICFVFMLSAANFWTSMWLWAWLALVIEVPPAKSLKSVFSV